MAEADLPKEDAEAETPAAPVPCPRRDQSFRQGLLKKLPPLGNAAWSVKENFRIDEEWGGIVNLRADPMLEALEKVRSP